MCDNFDFCEKCFYGRRGGAHKHSFSRTAEPGGAAVFAGRPGQNRNRRRSDASAASGLKDGKTQQLCPYEASADSWYRRRPVAHQLQHQIDLEHGSWSRVETFCASVACITTGHGA